MKLYAIFFTSCLVFSIGCDVEEPVGGGSAGCGGYGQFAATTSQTVSASSAGNTQAASSSGSVAGSSGSGQVIITEPVEPIEDIATAPTIFAWARFRPNGASGEFKAAHGIKSASVEYDGTELRFLFKETQASADYVVNATTGNSFSHTGYIPMYVVSRQDVDGFTVTVQDITGKPVDWRTYTTVELGVDAIR